MSEDITKDLTDSEKLNLILNRLTNIEGRLGALESAAEDRARETRPKLDTIIKEMSDLGEEMREVRKDLRSLHRKLDIFNNEMLAMKTDLKDFDERLTGLERRPN